MIYPTSLVLETVSVCNLRCPSCFVGRGMTTRIKTEPKLMPFEMVDKICTQAESFGTVKVIYPYLWGEPTIHPEIGAIVRRVKRTAQVSLSTHGMFVTEKLADDLALVDALSVSIDGLDQDTYSVYRVGGRFDDAMRGMKILAARKKGVVWEWVVHKHNEHQLDDARALAEKLGVTFHPRKTLLIDETARVLLQPKSETWARYEPGKTSPPREMRLGCREFWDVMYFYPSGDSGVCCYDYNVENRMGNINEQSLVDIWNGPAYTRMRENHQAGNMADLCENHCHMASF